ncbi:hypothetical protein CCACVL1_11597 [Corchorus capsularis]|uniref:Uncharacterized protein n=1 Tax=Corchorus capsularis TaxID=210143 RepID=A0A1R3IKB1_COCAP|nr:hypothetical protein CCACVL1_11597 [Corchorus capsularis]
MVKIKLKVKEVGSRGRPKGPFPRSRRGPTPDA